MNHIDRGGELYLIGGVSGSGKSTLAESLRSTSDHPGFTVCADEYMVDEHGLYHFDPTRLELVHLKCVERVARLMRVLKRSGARIFVHNTFLDQSEWRPYLELAERYGWRAHVLMVLNHHGGKSSHDVPAPALERQGSRLKRLIKEILRK